MYVWTPEFETSWRFKEDRGLSQAGRCGALETMASRMCKSTNVRDTIRYKTAKMGMFAQRFLRRLKWQNRGYHNIRPRVHKSQDQDQDQTAD